MKIRNWTCAVGAAVALLAGVASAGPPERMAGPAFGGSSPRGGGATRSGFASVSLLPNQTNGFGNGSLVTFTYQQNFDCVDEPTMDLDFNGVAAQSDPAEMQTPICQAITEPTRDQIGRAHV